MTSEALLAWRAALEAWGRYVGSLMAPAATNVVELRASGGP
jgi:hypothetical protein